MTDFPPVVHIWPWLSPWWNFWADATRLFEWRALAAIGTTTAVILALRRDQRGDQREWMKERALLVSLATYARTGAILAEEDHHAFPDLAPEGFVPDSTEAKWEADIMLDGRFIIGQLEGVNSVSITDLSSSNAIEQWMIARRALEKIEASYEAVKAGKPARAKKSTMALKSCANQWEKEAERLFRRSHPISSRVSFLRGLFV